MKRRDFVAAALALPAYSALVPVLPDGRRRPGRSGRALSQLADGHVEVLLDEPIGTIAPEIYGHFVEHLGGVVYDGLWVGEDSRVPNVGGIRKSLVEALAAVRPAVIRWPGGCFADAYDWRDGVGPRDRRPRRSNIWGDDEHLKALGNVPQKFEPNWFGTNEFVRFCRLVGAQPYFGANLRTLSAQVFHEWVDYCNAPAGSTSWADVRAAGGERDPLGVRYWGVGNESWGCGGNFTPEEYASEFRRFATWAVPEYGRPLSFIGSGPSGADYEWTRRFFAKLTERRDMDRLWGWAMHHYCSSTKGEAVAFDTSGWYELLASADKMEGLITSQWQVMREFDREHKVKLVVDEWGAWHQMTTNVDPSHLFGQQSTMRDALVAASTLDTFNRHADKVAMANIAQLVNCLQSLFLAHEDRMIVTPTYHVFAMYAPHQGARAVRTVATASPIAWTDSAGKSQTFWGLGCSASRQQGTVTLTLTNPHIAEGREVEIALRGGRAKSVRAMTLASNDPHTHNTFDQPTAVSPVARDLSVSGDRLVHHVPPASVTRLEVTLGG
ncbi:MAG: alpha-L-arabinofuranosidase C-terminal domain-containing protein [Gemmatimonadaceae bacterium]